MTTTQPVISVIKNKTHSNKSLPEKLTLVVVPTETLWLCWQQAVINHTYSHNKNATFYAPVQT